MEKKQQEEIWKQIPMYPTYAASNLGRIKNIKKDKLIIEIIKGYVYLTRINHIPRE